MSFMDKITSTGRAMRAPITRPTMSQFDDVVTAYPDEPAARHASAAGTTPAAWRRTRTHARRARSRRSSPRSTPSEMAGDFSETRLQDADADSRPRGAALPLIGHLRRGAAAAHAVRAGRRRPAGPGHGHGAGAERGQRSGEQVGAIGQALMQSQRLAKSVSQALIGSAAGLPGSARKAPRCWPQRACAGAAATANLPAAPAAVQEARRAAAAAGRARREERRRRAGAAEDADRGRPVAARRSTASPADLLEIAETVSSLKLQQGASAAELSAMGQLVMLTQRIGKSANEFLTIEGVNPEAVFLLGKDLNSFREIAEGLLDGNAELRLPGTRDAADQGAPGRADEAVRSRPQRAGRRDPGQPAGPGRRARGAGRDPRRQRAAAQGPGDAAGAAGGDRRPERAARGGDAAVRRCCCWPAAPASCACSSATRPRARSSPKASACEAERQEQEAKRVNDANQAAILRLMNELQTVAEGDLTQQATVTEDITGAIADSVNYTVEELRTLVSAGAEHGGAGDRHDAAGRADLDRAAGHVDRAAARDPRHRRVGAADGRAHQRGVGAGAATPRRWRASRCRRPSPACRRCRTRSAA